MTFSLSLWISELLEIRRQFPLYRPRPRRPRGVVEEPRIPPHERVDGRVRRVGGLVGHELHFADSVAEIGAVEGDCEGFFVLVVVVTGGVGVGGGGGLSEWYV